MTRIQTHKLDDLLPHDLFYQTGCFKGWFGGFSGDEHHLERKYVMH